MGGGLDFIHQLLPVQLGGTEVKLLAGGGLGMDPVLVGRGGGEFGRGSKVDRGDRDLVNASQVGGGDDNAAIDGGGRAGQCQGLPPPTLYGWWQVTAGQTRRSVFIGKAQEGQANERHLFAARDEVAAGIGLKIEETPEGDYIWVWL